MDRQVTVAPDAARTSLFDLQGAGSFGAFALAPQAPGDANAVLVGGASPMSSTDGKFLLGVDPTFGASSYKGQQFGIAVSSVVLDPGIYNLTLVSDAPVTLELRLPGLDGETALASEPISNATLRFPSNEVPSVGGALRPAGVGSAGAATFSGRGIALGFLRVETAALASGVFSICRFLVADAGDPHPCDPDGSKSLYHDRTPTVAPEPKVLVSASGWLFDSMRVGIGFAYEVAGVATASSSAALWIPTGG